MSDYFVKDIALADFDRKELNIAETEMPGLMALPAEPAICIRCAAKVAVAS